MSVDALWLQQLTIPGVLGVGEVQGWTQATSGSYLSHMFERAAEIERQIRIRGIEGGRNRFMRRQLLEGFDLVRVVGTDVLIQGSTYSRGMKFSSSVLKKVADSTMFSVIRGCEVRLSLQRNWRNSLAHSWCNQHRIMPLHGHLLGCVRNNLCPKQTSSITLRKSKSTICGEGGLLCCFRRSIGL